MARLSSYVIQYVNFLTLILSLAVLGFGAFLAIKHDGDCEKFLTIPVLATGGFILLVSLVGFVGAWKDIPILLWIYLIVMFFLLAAMAAFTAFAFVVTNGGAGHAVSGQGYKEYRLGDDTHWLQKSLRNPTNWKHLKSCLVKTKYCSTLSKQYKSLKEYKNAALTPIQSGCCQPPSECGFSAKNVSYFDLNSHSKSSTDKDCALFKNAPSIRCYNCDSCRAGVAEYLKKKWRLVAFFNIAAFAFLIVLYCVGCCARRNATYVSYDKTWD